VKLLNFSRLFIVLAAFCCYPLAQADTADSSTFTPAQRAQIESILHDYLLNHPDILVQVAQKLQQQQNDQMQQQAMKAVGTQTQALFNSPNSPVAGNPKGKVTLVEFFDYQCPHCKSVEPAVMELLKTEPNLRVVYKEFPIFGAGSQFASQAALAAQLQGKYPAFHAALMKAKAPFSEEEILNTAKSVGLDIDKLKSDMTQPSIKQELADNLQLANALGLPGTPGFIIAPTPTGNTAPPSNKVSVIPGDASLAMLVHSVQVAAAK